jgi:flagellin
LNETNDSIEAVEAGENTMGMSINTNVGAMIALQNLNRSNDQLEKTQLHITTGLKVNGPKDDASTYAIAQRMRGDIAGMQAVKTALAAGESTLNVAITAGKAISDMLTEMKAKAVQANQAGLDTASRVALSDDFTSLRDQLETIVQTAEFNGKNLITTGASALTVLSTVDGSTISVTPQVMNATALGLDTSTLADASGAATALTSIDAAINSVTSSLASLGSSAKRIEVQTDFTVQLVDILKEGVGNLVDADLAEESASLQALQIKQQLGVQALSIANSGPQSILSLFGG